MYDFIVVGAGSAGCVLASRLTEDPLLTVLLLEAGPPDKKQEIHVPAAVAKLFKTEVDWNYETEPQSRLNQRRLYWPRGKMLGGSSSMNAMVYMRGHPSDYDGWREAGNDGWGFSDVLPYFRKAEDQARGPSEYHGVGGPLSVADLRAPNPLSHAFVEACLEVGLKRNEDFNGASQDGAGLYQVTQRRGSRHSTAGAYLKPARGRANLTVVTAAHATRVLFDGTRATAVEYVHDGEPRRVDAGREVILSAGAVNSPQLLMLSGVGPGEHLQALGIPVVADLPGVGENLQDHPAISVCYACTQPVTLDGAESITNLVKYLLGRTGPFTSNVAEAGAFVRTRPDLSAPDLQLLFGPAWFIEHGFVKPPGHGFTLGPCLIRPRSRGSIHLRSSDPLAAPSIQPHYLQDPEDRRVLLEGIRLARRVAAARAFDPFRGAEEAPGVRAQSDDDLAAFLRRRVQTLYHPVGTCKMGRDPLSVVNPHLAVHGLRGLRVVDASIMPIIIGGNTNAPTIMIAEKAADLIRAAAS